MHFPYLMLFYRKEKMLYKQQKRLCAIYRNRTIAESTVWKWFDRLIRGNFDLEYWGHSYRHAAIDDDQIETLIKRNQVTWYRISQRYTTYLIWVLQGIWKYWIYKLLWCWMPQNLMEIFLINCLSICDSLLKNNKITHFLNEQWKAIEWIVYNNLEWKMLWGKMEWDIINNWKIWFVFEESEESAAIGNVLCIMSSFCKIRCWIQTTILPILIEYMKRIRLSQIERCYLL